MLGTSPHNWLKRGILMETRGWQEPSSGQRPRQQKPSWTRHGVWANSHWEGSVTSLLVFPRESLALFHLGFLLLPALILEQVSLHQPLFTCLPPCQNCCWHVIACYVCWNTSLYHSFTYFVLAEKTIILQELQDFGKVFPVLWVSTDLFIQQGTHPFPAEFWGLTQGACLWDKHVVGTQEMFEWVNSYMVLFDTEISGVLVQDSWVVSLQFAKTEIKAICSSLWEVLTLSTLY